MKVYRVIPFSGDGGSTKYGILPRVISPLKVHLRLSVYCFSLKPDLNCAYAGLKFIL